MGIANIKRVIFKIIVSILLIAGTAWVSVTSESFQYSNVKDNGRLQHHLTKKITEVAGVWASVKIASGVISVVQTIQVEGSIPVVGGLAISAQPLGWADVIDNTLDQVSRICLWAMGALAVQKVLLAVSVWVSLKIAVPVCIFFLILAMWSKKYSGHLIKMIAGVILISLAVCFAIPLSLEASNVIESGILSGYIDETVKGIESTSEEIEAEGSKASDVSLLRKMGSGIAGFFTGIKTYFDSMIEKAVNYLICFVVTNIIIPIGTLFFLKYLIGAILNFTGFSSLYRTVPVPQKAHTREERMQ